MAGGSSMSGVHTTCCGRRDGISRSPSTQGRTWGGVARAPAKGGGSEMSRRRSVGLIGDESGYYARIRKQRGGGYLGEFPDLRGCLTEGATLAEARKNAREALSGWLFVAIKHGDAVPAGRAHRGRSFDRIVPELDVRIALAIL